MNKFKYNFFYSIVKIFEENKIDYCLLDPDTDSLNSIDSDIDIAVSNLKSVRSLLFANQKSEYKIIQILRHSRFSEHIFLQKNINNENVIIGLDLYEKYSKGSKVYFNFLNIIKRKKFNGTFYFISNGDYVYYYTIKSLIKGVFHKNHKKINDYYKIYGITFNEPISVSKKNLFKSLIGSDYQSKNVTNFLNKIKLNYSFDFLYILNRASRVFYPTGFTISFTGPDGVGKSTYIKMLLDSELPFRSYFKFHLKPRLIGEKAMNKPVINPLAKAPYGFVLRIIKSVHLIIDYTVGYLISVFPKKTKSNLIIFDRYIYDLKINPERFRLHSKSYLNHLIFLATPKLNLNIFLIASPKTIINRKNELSLEEIKRQLKKMNEIKTNNNYLVINTSDSITYNINKIRTKIFNQLNERYRFSK